ncbi:LSM domain-containing protein [Cryptosporidium andersoni]|uniref:LSM domain-containing protein n=1 Tax=Cryptosporidium andersoni TaxID=117008 RepID=A0A1J4MNC5_9CRYT|nr:LSM domain-containing protein [Cryptosporidium andersoni]
MSNSDIYARRNPSDFLRQVIGKPVIVRLNSGIDYKGILACLDDRMNIAMEDTKEFVNGSLVGQHGDTFIRGNNVLYIASVNTSTV